MNCWVEPAAIDGEAGATAIDAIVVEGRMVMTAGAEVTVPTAAVIWTLPAFVAGVTRPAATVAMVGSLLVHVALAVTSPRVPSL